MDEGKVDMVGFAIDKENLWILKAKIDAASIDDSIPNQEKILTNKIIIIFYCLI